MRLLENKCGMVVGATSGIGRAAALLFAKEGAKVAVIGRRTKLLKELCTEIEGEGGIAIIITADVTKAKEVARMVAEAKSAFGKLDFAFNNAGTIGNFVPMLEQSEQDWDKTLDTNLKSIWLSVREQANAMKNGGAIVNTSSWLALGGLIGSTTYSASKAGMDGLLRPAALELAEMGIRINNINPGGVDTEMTREAFQYNKETLDHFSKSHPIGRMGSPAEIADLAAFLISDRASNITGQAIVIDGGYTIAGQRS
jgi:NAD(P)-dependent dehydrogenase (short-subunit alcohol dehydrogenase family)